MPISLVAVLTVGLFSTSSSWAEKIPDPDNHVCILYARNNFRGSPLLSLEPSVKVFDTNLLFETDDKSGIGIRSAKLQKSNCSVILCTKKHLRGECTEIRETEPMCYHQKIRSVDCHCSEGGSEDSMRERGDSSRFLTSLLPSDKVRRSQNIHEADTDKPCATIHRDWHYQGQRSTFQFPGAPQMFDLGNTQRVRSINVRKGCSLDLWGSSQSHFYSASSSTPFLQLGSESENLQWGCCSCDQTSQSACQSAKTTITQGKDSTTAEPDFSQFVKYGKKIVGIGRNYRWTVVDLAQALAVPTQPIVFLKPTTSYLTEGRPIEIPQTLGEIYYELELGVVIGKRGKDIPESAALDYVAGYFLALDMTAKDFIANTGNQSRPWEIGKGFDTACPVGDFVPKALVPNPNDVLLEAKVNGNVTQSDSTRNMIFNVQQLISYTSRYMTLEPYDVILTGTPDGFGSLHPGDVVQGRLGTLTSIKFTAVASNSA